MSDIDCGHDADSRANTIDLNRLPDYDPHTGDHYWIVFTSYRVDPATIAPGQQVALGGQNLVQAAGPGCAWCGNPYTPRLATRRCEGPQ